ncbi:glycosyltransferase family 4 protein [Acidicapsa dinghuensis]|uniref:Glycosyltransferase family 4 protein n=1 Tax=Acidicapsa dinghuensis TaxID=2218256 RepID=A0ABW1ELV3_9BACT|nr:glycosyltransferase family 4 protein [Acidicapsa dinghuensis]
MRAGLVIISHPTGNANVTAVVNALQEAALLEAFYTCIAWRPDSFAARLTPRSMRAMFERRARVQLPSHQIQTRPFRELVRNIALRAGKKELVTGWASTFSIDGIYRDLDKYVARSLNRNKDVRAVYAYEDGAVHQFKQAHELGIRCLYDLPIGYWRVNREISLEEAELQPEWKGTLKALDDCDEKLASKDQEIAQADTIFVASQYTRSTLSKYPGKVAEVKVIPYGTPPPIDQARPLTDSSRPLRVLYVGSLSQRKGISYLFEAVRMLGSSVTLTVIGGKVGHSDALDKACAQHRWIASLPHREILNEMSQHDVFVFPSLFEGFGLVIGEALSRGVPVITTPHTGGPDLLRDSQDGFIVRIRSAEVIAERLERLHRDRELLHTMSESARERAGQMTWQAYRDKTAAGVREAIS